MEYLYENLIAGGAYRFFLLGLSITMLIAATGLLIGTASGAILCAMCRCHFRLLRSLARIYILFMSGTPVLLILMLFFYVILAPLGTNAVVTAIIVFGLRSGAFIAGIMNSALSGVEPGQISAARTLGFSRLGAFRYIILPQAVRLGSPLFKQSAVTLVQDTSVVGYITANDLTRVVNSMGSRTGNPLAALLVGIALYLMLSAIVNAVLGIGDKQRRGGKTEKKAETT
jgi:polar amino acid transport system permease protein/polar amino acid transport system substrate-binding protein